MMRSVSEQTIKENRRLEGLVRELELLKKAQSEPVEPETEEWGSFTVLMMGLIAGSVASISMVIYVNVNSVSKPTKHHKHGRHHPDHKGKKDDH